MKPVHKCIDCKHCDPVHMLCIPTKDPKLSFPLSKKDYVKSYVCDYFEPLWKANRRKDRDAI